jgi:hypothetical protein
MLRRNVLSSCLSKTPINSNLVLHGDNVFLSEVFRAPNLLCIFDLTRFSGIWNEISVNRIFVLDLPSLGSMAGCDRMSPSTIFRFQKLLNRPISLSHNL